MDLLPVPLSELSVIPLALADEKRGGSLGENQTMKRTPSSGAGFKGRLGGISACTGQATCVNGHLPSLFCKLGVPGRGPKETVPNG